MGDKKLVNTSVQKSTKTENKPDGSIIETITTVTTEKFSDGSTQTKTGVETITKPPGSSPGGGGSGAKQPASVSPKDSNAPKAQNTTDQKFVQDCLKQHNVLRAKHHAPPLVINADLMKISQAWANTIAKMGKMQHSTSGFGENVYWSTEMVEGKRPADQWYSEIKDYNWKKGEGQSGTGHFTQVIWKGSQEFGVALAKGANGIYVVANYNPPGNFVSKYSENVKPI